MLLPYQREFIESDERLTVLMGGRGAGKTYAMCEAIRSHLRLSKKTPEVILAGYDYSWRESIESIMNDDRQSDPIVHPDGTVNWEVPIIDFYPVSNIDHHSLWGRRPTFVGVDNMELLVCTEREFHSVLQSVMAGGGVFRGTLDINSKMPHWLKTFVEGDDVRLINAFTGDNPRAS